MPAFVAISGYLSRGYRNSPRQVAGLITGLLVPYAVFQVLHELVRVLLEGRAFALALFAPAWTLWFLPALLVWRLLAPMLRRLRPGVLVGASIVLSVLAPLDESSTAGAVLGRVLAFLPFFALGLCARPEHLERIRDPRLRPVGAAVLLLSLIAVLGWGGSTTLPVFHMDASYDGMSEAAPVGMAMRLLVLVLGAIGTLAVLALTPRGTGRLTGLGTVSLTVYVLHGLILEPLRPVGLGLLGPDPWGLLIATGLGVLLALGLGSRTVVRATSWLVSPPLDRWVMRRDG
jgi:fucose 4-O-acetylase-like acetyltransferase